MEDKLTKLRGGVTLVSAEERKVVEKLYMDTISQWRRRKRMFKEVWDAITENSTKDLKEFKVLLYIDISFLLELGKDCFPMVLYVQEELGIEYDEDIGVSLQSFSELNQQGKKRARSQ